MKAFKALAILKLSAVAAFLIVLALLSYAGKAQADTVTLIGGGWSQHLGQDQSQFNQSHNATGLIYNDQYMLARMENSYHNETVIAAYNFKWYTLSAGNLDLQFNTAAGLSHGYTRDQVGSANIGGKFSLYVLPHIAARYWLTDSIAIGAELGAIPHGDGVVTTQTISLSFKF